MQSDLSGEIFANAKKLVIKYIVVVIKMCTLLMCEMTMYNVPGTMVLWVARWEFLGSLFWSALLVFSQTDIH